MKKNENPLNKNVLKIDISEVRKMFEQASKMNNPINLTLGLPDFDCDEILKQEAIKAIQNGSNKYTLTTGILPLKEKIKEKLKKKNNINVELSQIIITNAVSGALSIILTTILNPDDEVIIFDPYFVGYKELIKQNSAKPVYAKTKKDFSPDVIDLESKITSKTKAIIINSPNNPTGKVYSKQKLIEIAEICKKNNLYIISDEIYEEFIYEDEHFSIGSIYENTITLNGFSKAYGITGWRVGYCTGPKEIINQAIKVQQFNFVCAPAPFQEACIKCFEIDITKNILKYKENTEIIFKELKDNYSLIKPQGAFYAFIKYPYNGEKFINDCLKNNLVVVPGKCFSEKNDFFRISFCTNKEKLQKGIQILNKLAQNENENLNPRTKI